VAKLAGQLGIDHGLGGGISRRSTAVSQPHAGTGTGRPSRRRSRRRAPTRA
jgi:hypothetical protein